MKTITEEADMVTKSKRHSSIRMPHPAGYLREFALPALGISKTALAKALGVSRQTLYDLLDEKQGVTAAMALRLEAVVGSTAEHWLRVQMEHDLWKARREVDVSGLTRLREKAEDALEAAE
jgi:addiction module HigA family antidote